MTRSYQRSFEPGGRVSLAKGFLEFCENVKLGNVIDVVLVVNTWFWFTFTERDLPVFAQRFLKLILDEMDWVTRSLYCSETNRLF